MKRPIEASTIIAATTYRVGALLLDDPRVALPTPLRLEAGALHRDVVVTLDDPVERDERIVVGVAWRAADHAGFYPTFLGALEAEPSVGGTRLVLVGTYSIPLGVIGRFGDGLLGRRLAHEGVRSALSGIAARVNTALGIADTDVTVHVMERPSEAFIG